MESRRLKPPLGAELYLVLFTGIFLWAARGFFFSNPKCAKRTEARLRAAQACSRLLHTKAGDGSGAEEIYGGGFKASTLAKEIGNVAYPGLNFKHLN